MIDKVLTIGAYGFSADTFVAALRSAGVDLLLDVRARRGMRGATYAFANASRLESALGAAGIRYASAKEVAPTETIRDAQRAADDAAGVLKRDRSRLSDEFAIAYNDLCLASLDSREFVERHCRGAKRPALFCVEREPAACHRSLLAHKLASDLGLMVEDIRP